MPAIRWVGAWAAALSLLAATLLVVLVGNGGSTSGPSTPRAGATQHVVSRFTGAGDAQVGSISVPPFSELYWHTNRPPIRITGSGGLAVVGRGSSEAGALTVPSGVYDGVRVTTRGIWFIEVRSSAEGSR
jgi:hypothetical protein